MAFNFSKSLPIFCFILFAVISSVSAKEFLVGDAVGWRIPVTNKTQLYNVWASRRRFHIGDSLRFRYKNDSVAVVQKWAFYHCDPKDPIDFFNDGDTVINLNKVGPMYFISANADRCKEGVKMMLNVTNHGPVVALPPTIASPPEIPYSGMAPVMPQYVSPESSPGPSPSDAVTLYSVSFMVIGSIVGLGLFVLKA
ncbi:early nodulin-like protein 7 [Rutidosis leptorrhynchoides]|uniref:early nodulin-like protein 7 n=1 Tax=Rutidosis leptorrhynchoides TaxID=125765 RepID=UPI003A99DE32